MGFAYTARHHTKSGFIFVFLGLIVALLFTIGLPSLAWADDGEADGSDELSSVVVLAPKEGEAEVIEHTTTGGGDANQLDDLLNPGETPDDLVFENDLPSYTHTEIKIPKRVTWSMNQLRAPKQVRKSCFLKMPPSRRTRPLLPPNRWVTKLLLSR